MPRATDGDATVQKTVRQSTCNRHETGRTQQRIGTSRRPPGTDSAAGPMQAPEWPLPGPRKLGRRGRARARRMREQDLGQAPGIGWGEQATGPRRDRMPYPRGPAAVAADGRRHWQHTRADVAWELRRRATAVTEHERAFTGIANDLASAVEGENWVLAAQYVDIMRIRHHRFIEAIDSLAAEAAFTSQHVDAQANVVAWRTATRSVRWGQQRAPAPDASRGFHLAAIGGSSADHLNINWYP